MKKRLNKPVIILFFIILFLFLCFILAVKVEKDIISNKEAHILREESTGKQESNYPTNKEELMSQSGPGAFYDENAGLVFSIPLDYKCQKYNGYFVFYNLKKPESCFILITCSDTNFESSIDVLLGFSSVKEEITYWIDGKEKRTSLFDANGGYDIETIGNKEVLITSQKVYLSDKTVVNTSYYHTVFEGKALCIGTALVEGNKETVSVFAEDLIKSCTAVTFSGKAYLDPCMNFNFKEVVINGINIEIPDSWERKKISNELTVLRTPPVSSDPVGNSVIVFYCDRSLEADNPFGVIDRSYEINGEIYAAALVRNSSYLPELSDFKMIGSQNEITFNDRIFKHAKYYLKITPDISGVFSTLPSREVSAEHFATLMKNGETLNIVFFSEPNYSEQSLHILAERMMKTVK